MEKSIFDELDKWKKAKNYIDNVIESILDALIVVDPESKIQIVNKAACDLLGYKEKELIGKPVAAIFAEAGAISLKETRFKALLEKGGLKNYETYYKRKNGKSVPVLFSASGMKDEGDNIICAVCTARDITERKQIENALQSAYAQLKQTQLQLVQSAKMSTVGQLGAGVAHELNNPIGGILGYAQFILQKLSKPGFSTKDFKTCKQYIEHIEKESNRCKAIVENLLEFSRKPAVKFEAVDIKELTEKTLSIVRHQLKLQNIKVTVNYEPDLPLVNGNVNKLQQVFTNIIINAQHAMPHGGELNIRVGSKLKGREKKVEIKFKDTGCGIPKEDLGRIFEAFFTTKQNWKSVGIGLSITYELVKEHNGTITVESEVGKGTAFTIVLPVE